MNGERDITVLHSRVAKVAKVGEVLTPLAAGFTAWEALSANPLAFVSGACAIFLAGATVVNVRTERKLKKDLGINR